MGGKTGQGVLSRGELRRLDEAGVFDAHPANLTLARPAKLYPGARILGIGRPLFDQARTAAAIDQEGGMVLCNPIAIVRARPQHGTIGAGHQIVFLAGMGSQDWQCDRDRNATGMQEQKQSNSPCERQHACQAQS